MRAARRSRSHSSSATPVLWVVLALVGVVVGVVWLIAAAVNVTSRAVRRWREQLAASRERLAQPDVTMAAGPSRSSAPPPLACMAPGCSDSASHRSFDGPWIWCARHAGPADPPLVEIEVAVEAAVPALKLSAPLAAADLQQPMTDPAGMAADVPPLDDGGEFEGQEPAASLVGLPLAPDEPQPAAGSADARPTRAIQPGPPEPAPVVPDPREESAPPKRMDDQHRAEPGTGIRDPLAAARARFEAMRAANPYPKPPEFHAAARRYLVGLGYRIDSARPHRADGLDLMTTDPAGDKVLVRCRWEAETKRTHLETLLREMSWVGARRAIMIGCGVFGRKAQTSAEDQPLVLIDGV